MHAAQPAGGCAWEDREKEKEQENGTLPIERGTSPLQCYVNIFTNQSTVLETLLEK